MLLSTGETPLLHVILELILNYITLRIAELWSLALGKKLLQWVLLNIYIVSNILIPNWLVLIKMALITKSVHDNIQAKCDRPIFWQIFWKFDGQNWSISVKCLAWHIKYCYSVSAIEYVYIQLCIHDQLLFIRWSIINEEALWFVSSCCTVTIQVCWMWQN